MAIRTIQVDYTLPERFELEYIGADNQKHRPVMIHRALLLTGKIHCYSIREYSWKSTSLVSTRQFVVLPISEKYHDYAQSVFLNLQKI